jgi:glycine cleavage system protein P-like pyridoxal-binding family
MGGYCSTHGEVEKCIQNIKGRLLHRMGTQVYMGSNIKMFLKAIWHE